MKISCGLRLDYRIYVFVIYGPFVEICGRTLCTSMRNVRQFSRHFSGYGAFGDYRFTESRE